MKINYLILAIEILIIPIEIMLFIFYLEEFMV